MKAHLLTAIACPKCFATLTYNKQQQILTCEHDQLVFRIDDGIPVLLESQANPICSATSQGTTTCDLP